MGQFRYMLLLGILLALALAAPEGRDDAATAVEASEKSDDSTTKSVALVSDQTWETWFNQNTVPIVIGAIGAVLIVGGVSLGGYFYYTNYYHANANSGRSEALDPYNTIPYRDYSAGGQVPGYPNQYYSTGIGRSLDTSAPSGWNVNWTQVMYMISLAQEAYDKFDFKSMECQKKALCELASQQDEFGETGRKISNSFSLMDAVEGLPMPTIIQSYLKQYRQAINDGKNKFKPCDEHYPTCGFSLKEFIGKAKKKMETGKKKSE